MPYLDEKIKVDDAQNRHQHNLDLALNLAQFVAVHPCLNKSPLAKRHTELDCEIDRAAAIQELKAKHEKAQARLPEEERSDFRMPFQIGSSRDPETIQRWASEAPDFTPAISGGAGNNLYVVDCDTAKKEGDVDGVNFFHKLAERNGFDLLTVPATKTQSGGRHYFFNNPLKLGCGARGFEGCNIQIRAEGGYVIAPGSIRADGKRYEPVIGHADLLEVLEWRELLLIDAPQWLIDAAGSRPVNRCELKQAAVGFDPEDPTISDHVLFELDRRYPDTLHVGDRHAALEIATHLAFDCGLYEDATAELLTSWFDAKCDESLPAGEVEAMVTRLRNSRQDAIGRDFVANWKREGRFGAVDCEDEAVKSRRRGFRVTPFESFASAPLVSRGRAVIKGLIHEKEIACIFGDSNVGKTFFALDLAMRVAAGFDWCGRPVELGSVIYVAAENPVSIKTRAIAWNRHNGAQPDLPFYLAEGSLVLGKLNDGASKVIAEAKAIGAVALIVLDTLARTLSGNENAAEDVNAFVKSLDRIKDETGAALIVIHHAGKDNSRGARGSSAWRAAVDVEIEVRDGAAEVTKMRDGPCGETFTFSIEDVELNEAEEDEEPSIAGVAACSAGKGRERISGHLKALYEAACRLEGDARMPVDSVAEAGRPKLAWAKVVAVAAQIRIDAGSKPLSRSSVAGHRRVLKSRGYLVDVDESFVRLAR